MKNFGRATKLVRWRPFRATALRLSRRWALWQPRNMADAQKAMTEAAAEEVQAIANGERPEPRATAQNIVEE